MAIGLSKARKKQFKQQERERMASLESNANASSSQVVTTQKQLVSITFSIISLTIFGLFQFLLVYCILVNSTFF